jgi:hypothetical protein
LLQRTTPNFYTQPSPWASGSQGWHSNAYFSLFSSLFFFDPLNRFVQIPRQFEAVFKSGAKLFLEAELGADDAIADRFVDAAVGALFQATAHGTDEERKQKAESQVKRFVGRAHAGARRRGWDEEDAERRYHRRLRKLDHALERARHRADPRQRAALAHASESLERHRPKPKTSTPPMLEQPDAHSQPARSS